MTTMQVSGPMGRFVSVVGRGWNAFSHMMELSASRHQLAELDDAALRDMGISRAQARFEAMRAPWDDAPLGDPAPRRVTALRAGEVRS